MRRELRHRLEDRAAGIASVLVRLLTRRAALALGGWLGRILGDLDRRHVSIAVDSLRRAFPHWDEARALRTAREVYAHFGGVLFEILWLRGRPAEQVLRYVEIVGREHVEAAIAAGRGVVFPTGHIGNWEITALCHGWVFGPLGVVARPLDNPLLETRLLAVRVQGSNTVISKKKALAQVLRILREGGGVGILIDQNVQEQDGIFVEFFDRPAATTTVAAALAVKTGCALVPGYTRRLPDGRYQLVYQPALRWAPSGDRRADIARLTQAATRCIEGWVRETPEQWLWMHRRWHTQPRVPAPEPSAAGQGPSPRGEREPAEPGAAG